jgi:hypothetical protein
MWDLRWDLVVGLDVGLVGLAIVFFPDSIFLNFHRQIRPPEGEVPMRALFLVSTKMNERGGGLKG